MTLICTAATILPAYLIPCGIGVFALSFGDGAAGVFGQAFSKMNLHITKTKTAMGTIGCFIFSIVGTVVLSTFIPFPIEIIPLLIIGVTAALMEIIGGHLDNYTVPFGTTIVAVLLGIGEV
jgi:dolichol kinase